MRKVRRVALGFMLLASPAFAAVTVQSWTLNTQAGDFVDGPGEASETDSTVAFPFNFTRTVQSGASNSSSTYSFQTIPSGATFHLGFYHVRDGDGPPGGTGNRDFASSSGSIIFTTSHIVSYEISGFYDMVGPPNGMSLSVSLLKLPTQTQIYTSNQADAVSQNAHFEIGGQEGSIINILVGSPTGQLAPGSYLLGYHYAISASTPDMGASATGTLDFVLIPEPSSALSILLLATLIKRPRHR